MRAMSLIVLLLVLYGCMRVGSDPWMLVDYTEGECGTKKAILTTTGCITAPAPDTAVATADNSAISNPNDVGGGHTHSVHR